MTEWFPPPPTPKLARRFICPQCDAEMALEYAPDFDAQLVPTLFECSGCHRACSAELPGRLRQVMAIET